MFLLLLLLQDCYMLLHYEHQGKLLFLKKNNFASNHQYSEKSSY